MKLLQLESEDNDTGRQSIPRKFENEIHPETRKQRPRLFHSFRKVKNLCFIYRFYTAKQINSDSALHPYHFNFFSSFGGWGG